MSNQSTVHALPVKHSFKMQSIYFLATVTVLASFIGQIYGQANQTCQHTELVTPVHNFTVDRFLGTWYGYKVYSGLAENVRPLQYRCLNVTLSRTNSEVLPLTGLERFVDISVDPNVRVEVTDYMSLSEKNPAIWTALTITDTGDILESDSVYVQTDYENWAIHYGCSVRSNYRYETMFITTRTPNPDPEVMKILEILVKNYGYPAENGVLVDQTNC